MPQELERFDRGPALAAPITAGIFEGRVARTHGPGDGLRYDDGDEYRDAAELALIVAQLPGTPITLTHPEGGLLSAGAQAKIVGRVSAARVDGEHVVATLVITDQETLDAIAAGVHQLSLGYRCTLDENRYQRGIRVDHLALVPRARCGSSCALRADGIRNDCGDAPCACNGRNSDGVLGADLRTAMSMPISNPHVAVDEPKELAVNLEQALAALAAANEKNGALAVKVDQAERERDTAIASLEVAAKAKADAEGAKATAEADALSARKDAEAAQVAAIKAKADAEAEVSKARSDAATLATAEARERIAVETAANEILGAVDKDGKSIDRSDMSLADIKRAVVKHVDGEDIANDAHEKFVDGMFAGARKRHAAGAKALAETRETLNTPTQVVALDGLDAEKAAAKAARDRIGGAWMTPPTKKGE